MFCICSFLEVLYSSSAVSEMGNRMATKDMGRKLNGDAVSLSAGVAELGPI